MKTYFIKLRADAIIPTFAEEKAACVDLYIPKDLNIKIYPHTVCLIPTGVVALPPKNYHWILCLRSSTPFKNPGIVLANGIGVIDESYSGPEDEIKIAILSKANDVVEFEGGQRIAQMFLRKNIKPQIEEMTLEKLKEIKTFSRNGFGSTGK